MNDKNIHILYVLTKLELGGAQKVCLSLLEGVHQELSTSLMSGTQGPLVEQAKKHLGANGGYILAPAHHIQADTPVENVLAIYAMD